MAILVLNSGSSSIKYGSFNTQSLAPRDRGVIDLDRTKIEAERAQAIRRIIQSASAETPIDGIGHRIVHGGEQFRNPVLIDAQVLARIHALNHLAPLHNPAGALGIEIALETAPDLPQVAVFDTAFSSDLPESAWRYALPKALADRHGIRRYGFHGISHQYVAGKAAELLQTPLQALRLITLHLGNGASAAAIAGGRCLEISMGMTPQEGLVMGTRAGDLDPSILLHLRRHVQLTTDDLEQLLNRESGLLGLCAESDMRTIRRRARGGDGEARLAIDIYIHRLRKYIGAYAAVLDGFDALVFTGGIGEHDADLRAELCSGLASLGLRLDPQRNQQTEAGLISCDDSPTRILVVPTNEELAIAREVQAYLAKTANRF